MAGCTSRVLFKFTVSSFIIILTVFYFLRRKRHFFSIPSDISQENIHSKLFQFSDSMNLLDCKTTSPLSQVAITSKSNSNSSSMHLEDDSRCSAQTDMDHLKTDDSGNSAICYAPSQGQEKLRNGATATTDFDKTADKGNLLTHLPGASNTCIIEEEKQELKVIVNGISSLSINVESDPKELCNGNGEHNGSSIINGVHRDELSSPDGEIPTLDNLHHDSCDDNDSPRNGLSPEVSPVPKMPTPDSGICTEAHSDTGSSTMSEPSDFLGDGDIGALSDDTAKSPTVSDSSDTYKASSETFQESLDCGGPEPACIGAEYASADPNMCRVFEFEIPQDLCGLLIGKAGRHVKYIKERTNAEILIKQHPILAHLKACAVAGSEEEIDAALSLIRARFPSDKFPTLTLLRIDHSQPVCSLPVTAQLPIPEGVTFDVIVSHVVSGNHVFVQQPTHPTFYNLSWLSREMNQLYSQEDTPPLLNFSPGYVVAAPHLNSWFRAEVIEVNNDSKSALLKLLDYGGFITVGLHLLRQMKVEFLCIPFQATECYLANVECPQGVESWSEDARKALETMACSQLLCGYISAYAENGVPLVHLYRVQGASNTFINEEFVNRGYARWVEYPSQ